ncbi:hypothetical protein [Methanococcus maripaludis]|uniref:Uncharacterized membrane protein YraQ (UPF0718 family) n=2 Tax=Methanococcus maripaludis TaxID=39152 RepID=A0A7J9PK15_METMI|nr:hypothetical protein [Methanococcus maripaludis]MBA2862987.1 uncharacterized membrane protein YraQ (UPF0718 family) [Methanococcus maripaludis]
MSLKNKLSSIPGSWYFLISVILIYIIVFIVSRELFFSSIHFSYDIILKIIPILILVFILLALSDYFITPKIVTKYLQNKGIKKWIFVIIGGILSSGPIYMWYPLLADLKYKGMTDGLIACFLYNRALKIPLLPIAILYFGWKYMIVLSLVMILMSVIQGIIIDKLMGEKL